MGGRKTSRLDLSVRADFLEGCARLHDRGEHALADELLNFAALAWTHVTDEHRSRLARALGRQRIEQPIRRDLAPDLRAEVAARRALLDALASGDVCFEGARPWCMATRDGTWADLANPAKGWMPGSRSVGRRWQWSDLDDAQQRAAIELWTNRI